MASPKPKPTALKRAAGNPGNRPLPLNEPEPHGDLDRPPPELTQAELAYWRHAVDNAPLGLLKCLDRDALRTWCRAAAINQEAREQVEADGLVQDGQFGLKAHPLLPTINQTSSMMLKAGSELGFSPVARTRISLEAPADDNPYDAIERKRA